MLPAFIRCQINWGLYGRLNDAAFRNVILALLLVSGVALIVPMR